jgi:formamidopyrimidine-DNA glycosylase
VLYDPDVEPAHVRVRIVLDDGHNLVYDDPRRFGTGEVSLGREALDAFFVARLGVEPFSDAFTPSYLRALGATSRAPIKAFLLDQKRVAGVGNIYADEALFRAQIHPLREARRLRPRQWEALHGAVLDTLRAGIDAAGASIDDYRDPDGVSGSFQDEFLVHLHEGDPCPRCATPIRKLFVGGRGTYVCVGCQPVPRRRRD